MSSPLEPDSAPPPFGERRVAERDRRALTLRTFLAGGFSPRRRGGRRLGEQEQPVDFHEPYLLALSLAMLALSVTDAFFTVTLMTDGAKESNPVLAFALDEYPRLFAVTKMALTGFGVVVLVAAARLRVFRVLRARTLLTALVLAYGVLVGYEAWLLTLMET
jgi:hypothetical protein